MGALEDDLTEYHRMRDRDARIKELEELVRQFRGEDEGTPFEAVHAHIRDGVLRAAQEIRERDDVQAAHQI